MNLAQMKGFILELMAVPFGVLKGDILAFCNILETLLESYNAGTYFEVGEGDKQFFLDFSTWIQEFSKEIGISAWNREGLESIAKAFLIFPDEVYGGN
ncbi:hypothetical protein [Acidovorax sp. NCPPB 3576]|uniref:hypothetical protein n=1 Tax=Acidovorax sp. NCPPB 3576 TaxID=2940488 RepID=UPI00234BBAE5|nr:hypothetical protein [Acidovorax sp. NCPPB 3576]WCM88928.1 hypothetical protein M5C98_02415 [Acidovorax sp. NCPPB 3576]